MKREKFYKAHYRGDEIHTTKDNIVNILMARGYEAERDKDYHRAQDYFQHTEMWRNGDYLNV